MRNILVVVDMQKDFINGALGSDDAQAILSNVKSKISGFDGEIIFTRDTHEQNYLQTREGIHLPVTHCIRNTQGWQIDPSLISLREARIVDKPTFGSWTLAETLSSEHKTSPISSVTLIGLCTDICVISNAMLLKAALPEVDLIVDASCCAGVTPESHRTALRAMKACQIRIENE